MDIIGLEAKSRWVIAMSRGRIFGHAILCPISGIAVEFTIFVHQGFRGEGLGTIMAERALSFAGQLGFKVVYLTTEFSNLAAVRLYPQQQSECFSSFSSLFLPWRSAKTMPV